MIEALVAATDVIPPAISETEAEQQLGRHRFDWPISRKPHATEVERLHVRKMLEIFDEYR